MAYRSSAHLGLEEQDALLAAVAPSQEAESRWRAIMDRMAFDEVNANTQRVMPAIFHNLRNIVDVPERDRMRGAFKHSWSKNTRMLYDLRPVLQTIDDTGVDYRIIKGAAVQTVCGSIGARVMGDIDILTNLANIDAVACSLLEHGFRRSAHLECSGHSDTGHFDAWNFNKDETHIDVHVAEVKYPSPLLQRMISTPQMRVKGPAGALAVPPAELLVLHAAVHGDLSSGPTDLMQAALDLSLLRASVNRDRLLSYAIETGSLDALRRLDATLESLGLNTSGVRPSYGQLAVERVAARRRRVVALTTESSSVARRVADRRRNPDAKDRIRSGFNGHRSAYMTWIQWGRFAATERAAVRLWGGFLEEPGETLRDPKSVTPFLQGYSGITASSVPGPSLDWRFRVRLDAPIGRGDLRFDSPALDRLDAFVFINGIPRTRIVAGDLTTRTVGIQDMGPSMEISLRPLWNACERCYSGLDDLEISLETGS